MSSMCPSTESGGDAEGGPVWVGSSSWYVSKSSGVTCSYAGGVVCPSGCHDSPPRLGGLP
eukprot:CAMPEP_0197667712 /NCGR_PEP_ID=MMETSP1338-20131121/67186_1 /TAXON_ID=43686 ORGANISM="Pelagodinium beii, Strain RCC1491" /NCGR_SAMPLE_ID=MMETSP1338 /ASSEMBLY_ACC=CAM_ASM_000754 /LENGTH=59 /DNA_ID=CAMNT_0043247005 /DNA_START=154 /DNA_END=329 /DNA_ORIENTATION=-